MTTRTLEIPTDLDAQIQAAARAQNTDEAAWLLEAARRALEATREESPMAKAVAHIKANPIRSLGPLDAAADLEEVRAGRMEELSAKSETSEERRARIHAAISDAQRHFAPMMHGGDAVSQLMAEKRADNARAMERGL